MNMRFITAFVFLSVLSSCNKTGLSSLESHAVVAKKNQDDAKPYIYTTIDHFKIVTDNNGKGDLYSVQISGNTASDSVENIVGQEGYDPSHSEQMDLTTMTYARNVAQSCQDSFNEFRQSQGKLEFVIYAGIVHCSTRNSPKT